MRSPRKRRKRGRNAIMPHSADYRENVFATDKVSLVGRHKPLTPEQRIALWSWANAG